MSSDLIPLYYVSGTAVSIVGVVTGVRAIYSRQRKRWTDEGVQRQKSSDALERNTEAAEANTTAVRELSTKLDRFAEETRRELNNHHVVLNDHRSRLERIEDVIEAPLRTRRRDSGGS
jgi:hypothetical protein